VTDLAQFAGRFHPLLVHFPIALLLLAALLRLIEGRLAWSDTQGETSYRWSRLVLALGAVTSVASATTGWLLGNGGGYAGDSFLWHQRLGIAVAVAAALALAVGYAPGRQSRRLEAMLLATAVALMLLAGHLGATLTHGEGYLTDHAPPMLRRFLGGASGPGSVARLAGRAPDRILLYADLVAPVLETQCVSCHGPTKVEGDLRLDTAEGITKGGHDGPVIAAGRLESSQLLRRIFLPRSHEDAMPPKGHPPLSPADAALIRWWVDTGARFDLTLEDAEIAPEVLPVIEALAGSIGRGGPTLPVVAVPEAPSEAVAAVRAEGFSVARIADGHPFLHVHSTNATTRITDASLKVLGRIAPQLLWLDLGGTSVSDRGLAEISRLPNLTRLHLQHTQVGNSGVALLAGLQRLEYLNLYRTAVTDEGLGPLTSLKRLRALYVWETGVTPSGISRLQAALPRLTIEAGAGAPPQSGSAR
jgi:uncharacterized membrane protein